jgi:hypothetical protein
VDGTFSYPWSLRDFFRKIALVRNADDLVHQAKRSRDLGGCRQQGNDAMHYQAYTLHGSR